MRTTSPGGGLKNARVGTTDDGVLVMRVGLLGRKVGVTQIYEADGTAVPITVLECGPCTVLQVRTEERTATTPCNSATRTKTEERDPSGTRPRQKSEPPNRSCYVRELRQDGPTEVAEGQTLTVEVFNEIGRVDVIGTSKGRGFSGVVKRHGFKGLRATHGVSACTVTPDPPAPPPIRLTPARASASRASTATPESR